MMNCGQPLAPLEMAAAYRLASTDFCFRHPRMIFRAHNVSFSNQCSPLLGSRVDDPATNVATSEWASGQDERRPPLSQRMAYFLKLGCDAPRSARATTHAFSYVSAVLEKEQLSHEEYRLVRIRTIPLRPCGPPSAERGDAGLPYT